jgi:hypothetical protein
MRGHYILGQALANNINVHLLYCYHFFGSVTLTKAAIQQKGEKEC